MSLFIQKLNGGIINGTLVTSVRKDFDDDTKVVINMKNGSQIIEQLTDSSAATTRLNAIKALLKSIGAGGASKEEVEELRETVAAQTIVIETLTTTIETAETQVDGINGEEV